MKNNKGFVLSTYVYMLLVFFLLMLTVMLSVLGNSKLLANKMKEGLSKILGANGGTISIILKGNKEDYTSPLAVWLLHAGVAGAAFAGLHRRDLKRLAAQNKQNVR